MAQKNSYKYKSFIEDSDPIHDMGIGMDQFIKDWVENETKHIYNKKNLLWICARENKADFVRYLLDQGYDVDANSGQALRWASDSGYTEIVKMLIDAGADIHVNGNEPIYLASKHGHIDIVKMLIDAGANVRANNSAPFHWASYYGHIEVVKLLLDAGANVHAENNKAIRWAKEAGHTEVIKFLQDYINKKSKVVKESISHFKEDSDPIKDMGIGMYKIIKDWAKDYVKSSNYDDNDLLWLSAAYGKLEYVKYLLNHGYDIHYLNDKALSFASLNGNVTIVRFLLDAGADVHASEERALQWASSYDEPKIVKVLLDAGADLHIKKDAPLCVACEYGHTTVVEILLDAGANVHAQNDLPLFNASMNGHHKVVDILLAAGANLNKIDKEFFKEMEHYGYELISKKFRKLSDKTKNNKTGRIVKESITHFTEEGDPIKDMGIGINPKAEAVKFMKKTRGGLIDYIAEIYFNDRKKASSAWVLYSFFNGILKGMDPQDAFYKAAEYENYHGIRPDIVAARKEITDAIKKRHYIDIDYNDPRL